MQRKKKAATIIISNILVQDLLRKKKEENFQIGSYPLKNTGESVWNISTPGSRVILPINFYQILTKMGRLWTLLLSVIRSVGRLRWRPTSESWHQCRWQIYAHLSIKRYIMHIKIGQKNMERKRFSEGQSVLHSFKIHGWKNGRHISPGQSSYLVYGTPYYGFRGEKSITPSYEIIMDSGIIFLMPAFLPCLSIIAFGICRQRII